MIATDDLFYQVDEEDVAAWLDGTLPPESENNFMSLLSTDPELADILDTYDEVESSFEDMVENGYELPADLLFDFDLPQIEDEFFDDAESFETDFAADEEDGQNFVDEDACEEEDDTSCHDDTDADTVEDADSESSFDEMDIF